MAMRKLSARRCSYVSIEVRRSSPQIIATTLTVWRCNLKKLQCALKWPGTEPQLSGCKSGCVSTVS
jgi:hypothetical protein